MDDSFSFGKPARRQAAVKRAPRVRPARAASSRGGTGRVVLLVAVGIVAVVAIAGVMALMHNGGEQVAANERSAVSQIGAANDVDAKMTAEETASAVQQLYAEQGSFNGIGPAALKRFEPTFSYTSGASTGPNVVSVQPSADGVGLAVRSASGTCFFDLVKASGATTGQGSGDRCVASAALSVSGG
jgi:hypothetical protein